MPSNSPDTHYSQDNTYREIYEYLESIPVVNTHSHHSREERFNNFNLVKVLVSSYINWCRVPVGKTPEEYQRFLDKVRYNSYFVWLEKALGKLYGFEGKLTVDNWQTVSDKINTAHSQPGYHLDLLKNTCGYEKIILDAYNDPGADNGYPEIFAPTFRINAFLYSYLTESCDHNKNNFLNQYGVSVDNIDDYVAFMHQIITRKKEEGCVALKSALAYDRPLDFEETTKDKAGRVFKSRKDATPEEIKAFGDYIFFEICKIAAELNLPIQNHTGLGILDRTNPMQMREVIQKNPETKFVLFHGGYPWIDEICGLVHNYPNVYPDLCWLPIISTSAARRLTEELIEVGTSDKVCWGCDTWTPEESLGALMAFRHVLASVLSRKVREGYLTMEDARVIGYRLQYANAKDLYGLR